MQGGRQGCRSRRKNTDVFSPRMPADISITNEYRGQQLTMISRKLDSLNIYYDISKTTPATRPSARKGGGRGSGAGIASVVSTRMLALRLLLWVLSTRSMTTGCWRASCSLSGGNIGLLQEPCQQDVGAVHA